MNLADCYRLLGLRTGASYDEVKVSYRRLARQYHPDVNPDRPQQAQEKFIQLTEAYRRLVEAIAPGGLVEVPQPAPTSAPSTPSSVTQPAKTSPPPSATQPSSSPSATQPATPPKTAAQPSPPRAPKRPSVRRDPETSPTDYQLKERTYARLQQLLREQRFPRAIALVEGLAQRLPTDQEVRQWQAIAYQRWGRYLVDTQQPDKARIYLTKALRTDPRNRALWFEVERDLQRIERIEIL